MTITENPCYTLRLTQDYALFALRQGMAAQDRARFKSLACALGCYRAPDFKNFTLTPIRGQKLDRLFRAGFCGHDNYFSHPAIPSKRFLLKGAIIVLDLAEFLVDSVSTRSQPLAP